MAFYSYSPWADAANFGSGVGRTLGAALAQRPEIQAQAMALRQRISGEQQQQQQSSERFPLEQELLKAQAKNLDAQPALKQLMYELALRRADNGQQSADANMIRANAYAEHLEQPQVRTPAQAIGDTRLGQKVLTDRAMEEYPDVVKKPSDVAMPGYVAKQFGETLKDKSFAGEDAGKMAGAYINPKMEYKQPGHGLGMLGALLEKMGVMQGDAPELQQTGVGFKVPQELIDSFAVRHSGEVPNASIPIPPGSPQNVPTGMVRMKNAQGQTGLVPASQVQDALKEGYTPVQ